MIPTPSAKTEAENGPDLLARIWLFLTRPWLLFAVGGLALLFSVSAAFLPQLPGQLATDPVGASRWFLTTANEYGAMGNTIRDLGLFDYLHSLPLRFLLTGLGLLLLLHIGDLAERAWGMRRLAAAVTQTDAEVGRPLTLPMMAQRHRRRLSVDRSPAILATETAQWLSAPFPHQTRTTHGLAGEAPAGQEERILATVNEWAAWLRLAGGAGLLLALGGLWLVVNVGWSVHLPVLAPGDSFRYASQKLTLTYDVPSGRPPAEFRVQFEEAQGTLSGITPATADQGLRLGTVQVDTRSAVPGLLISSNRAALAPAGQSQLAEQVGLLFPSPGSEETVTLPEQEYALRLVRLPAPAQGPIPAQPTFQVELFDSSSLVSGAPVQRLELRGSEGSSIFLDRGQLQIAFVPMPGLTVSVRSMPGLWLLWPALALILVGSVGFLRRPGFLLAQIAPWPADRSVLILQSDDPDAVESLAAFLNGD